MTSLTNTVNGHLFVGFIIIEYIRLLINLKNPDGYVMNTSVFQILLHLYY